MKRGKMYTRNFHGKINIKRFREYIRIEMRNKTHITVYCFLPGKSTETDKESEKQPETRSRHVKFLS